jgi:hypothetical protein
MSAEIVRGFSQFLLGGLQGADSGVNVGVATLSDGERESAHDDHSGQESNERVFHHYNVSAQCLMRQDLERP